MIPELEEKVQAMYEAANHRWLALLSGWFNALVFSGTSASRGLCQLRFCDPFAKHSCPRSALRDVRGLDVTLGAGRHVDHFALRPRVANSYAFILFYINSHQFAMITVTFNCSSTYGDCCAAFGFRSEGRRPEASRDTAAAHVPDQGRGAAAWQPWGRFQDIEC